MGYQIYSMTEIKLHGKPAIKITAFKVHETEKAILLNCEGDEIWFPKNHIKYNDEDKTVVIAEWIYYEKFPEEI